MGRQRWKEGCTTCKIKNAFSCHLLFQMVLLSAAFVLPFSPTWWLTEVFNPLSQVGSFIPSVKTFSWNESTSEVQGFLMWWENVIFGRLSIIITLNHILCVGLLIELHFKTLRCQILGNTLRRAKIRCFLWHLPTSWSMPVQTDLRLALKPFPSLFLTSIPD